jgi:hypothetical protein
MNNGSRFVGQLNNCPIRKSGLCLEKPPPYKLATFWKPGSTLSPTMPKASTRSPLPTSSSDFALPSSSSSSPGASSSSVTLDDPGVLFHRLRRSSFLQKAGYLSESRLHSPLASAYTFHARRRSQNTFIAEESESDKDRMMTDSPNSSETHTPPLKVPENSEEDLNTVTRPVLRPPPLTPPRRRSSASMDASDMPTIFNRRLAFPVRFPGASFDLH